MEFILVFLVVAGIAFFLLKGRQPTISITHLPEQFVVFDLETTGLDAAKHEIIEIAAIRVNRDSTHHDTIQALVKPTKKVPKKIVELTGITLVMLDRDGKAIEESLRDFAHPN